MMTLDLGQFESEVGEWHLGHFGHLPEIAPLLRKLGEEHKEFQDKPCGEEAADIIIVLCAWAHREGVDLAGECRQKIEKVKARNQKARDAEPERKQRRDMASEAIRAGEAQ